MKNPELWTLLARDIGDREAPTAAWVLEHICGWEGNPQEEYGAKRTLEDVLRWVGHHEAECRNEPTGFILTRTWATVPAGWFVKAPNGSWLEVGKTSFIGSTGTQMVSLRVGEDFHAFPRDPSGEVKVKRGTWSPVVRDDAITSLEAAFTTAILHDEPPGQS
jgi:hypothetical protein